MSNSAQQEGLSEDLSRKASSDETGEVDLEQIRYNLSLTPAQRLDQLEQFIQFVSDARRRNGIE